MIMNKTKQFSVKGSYVSPDVKIATMRARRNILTGSLDGQYGNQGSAGHDGGYDPYDDDNDL